MSEDDDRHRAELAFLDERLSALRAELQCNEAELGVLINDETALQIVTDVVSVLRAAGKADLATRYSNAVQQATAAIDHHRSLVVQGAHDTVLQATRDAQDDAIEDLQRLDAEVERFFEDRGKGGEG